MGNLIVSSPSVAADVAARPAVWSGSHIDTVPNGGRFDGALGTIAALECLRRMHEEGIVLERPVCSVVYTDEEGCYAHLLGSSALARGFSRSELEAMVGRDGDRFVDTFTAAGGHHAATKTRIDPASLHATVKLHIEQGPTLEKFGHQIGVVTGIVGLGGGVVTFRGRADHAGTTPMKLRKDALVAAGALVAAFPDFDGVAVAVKVAYRDGTVVHATPEFEDVAAAAAPLRRPVRDVLAAASAAASRTGLSRGRSVPPDLRGRAER